MISRRELLLGAAAALSLGIPGSTLGAGTPTDRKLVFVFNPGGWDPTRALVPAFANTAVDLEALAEPATAGGIRYVDHPSRPAVRSFMERHHGQTLVLNGLMVRSIAHEICTMIAMTGSSSGTRPDWPALVGGARRDAYTLPHLVISGPSFPGDQGVAVARAGVAGQLEELLSGLALDRLDRPARGPNPPAESLVDRYLLQRSRARADAAVAASDVRLSADHLRSMEKIASLKDLRYGVDFTASASLSDQVEVAVDALAQGISRCVTVSHVGSGWDTHADNDNQQSPLWEELFTGLGRLLERLATTPSPSGAPLSEETLVVVLSEMGRSPQLNSVLGKDHWPYTSAMLVGPGITGDRVVGGFDGGFAGRPVDPSSGEVAEDGPLLSAESLGATLLAYADIDPAEHVPGVAPLTGVLA